MAYGQPLTLPVMRRETLNHNSKVNLLLLVIVLLSGCMASGPTPTGSNIAEIPMYGGMDRKSDPRLREADETLIAGVTKEFGSREKASQVFVDQGIRYYQVDNYSMAMKRFNQAWLIDPSSPGVFWGFAIVYHDEGKNCQAREMLEKAVSLGLSNPISLADAGRIYTLCAVGGEIVDATTKERYLQQSEEFYKQAESAAPGNDYIYGLWATAYYWRGDYVNAWKMVNKQRSLGGTPGGQFINLLRAKMAEPH